ncbi:MAG: TonB-dependent receptor [Rubricoccaceae bacterium]
MKTLSFELMKPFELMKLTLLLLTCVLASAAQAQTVYTLQGAVSEAGGVPLPGASVRVFVPEGPPRGAAADAAGRFVVPGLPAGAHRVEVRFVGYRPFEATVEVPRAAPLAVRLVPETRQAAEVIITATPTGSAGTQAAQAFRLEELQRRAAPSFGEMLDGAPGVAMRSFGSAPARPVIRGLDGDRVLVLENGERMGDLAETAADHAIALDPLAVHRIEIVRGPASLLYGPSAIGGVVNLFNEDVPQTWSRGASGHAAGQVASVNRLGAGHGRFVYGTDAWAAGGRVAFRGAGNTRTPEGPLLTTSLRGASGAGGASVRVGEGLLGGALAAQALAYGLPEPDAAPGERVEIRMRRLTATGLARLPGAGRLTGVEVRALAAGYGHDEVEAAEGDEDVALSFRQATASATVTAQHGALGPFTAGAVGASVSVRDLRVGGEEALTPDAASAALALFVFEEVALGRGLGVQGGLRLDVQDVRARANAQYPGFRSRRTTPVVSGALGLRAAPAEGLALGVQVAQAYRVPRLEELYADAPHLGAGVYEIGDPTLGNEVARGLDAFAQAERGRLRGELAAFASRIDGFVAFQPTGDVDEASGLPVVRYEATDAVLVGAEASAVVPLARALAAELSADVVRGTRRDAAATPLPAIPPLRARLALAWDDGRVRLGASARVVAQQQRVAPEETVTPGYTLLGLEAAYRLERIGRHVIALRADNLLDVAYRDHLTRVELREAAMPGRNLVLTYQVLF